EQRDKVVGFAVAINGNVATVDMFASHALFQKLEGKLVRSYLTESVDVAVDKTAKPPKQSAITGFMADAEKATEERSYDSAAAATAVKKGKDADEAVVRDAKKPQASPVYKTYQAH